MSNSYLPRADGKALLWMRAFASGISDDPQRYMLAPSDAATIAAAVGAFDAALLAAQDPRTGTRVTVRHKDEARYSAEQVV